MCVYVCMVLHSFKFYICTYINLHKYIHTYITYITYIHYVHTNLHTYIHSQVTQEEAFRLEDIVAAKNSEDSKTFKKIHWTTTDKDSSHNEYVWEVLFVPIHTYIHSFFNKSMVV